MIFLLLVFVLFIVALTWFYLRPLKTHRLVSSPQPADTYSEALARIAAIHAEEAKLDLNSLCQTRLLTHGEKTGRVIIFFHGFTSCPHQFSVLAEQFFSLGYNVYLPRTPYHGSLDRSGAELEVLTAEELVFFADASVDIARGLGEEVIVAGLSGGGTISMWLYQHRTDVSLVVPISPFVGVGFVPPELTRVFTSLVLALPDFYMWWDPRTKAANPLTATYAYPRFPVHALVENLRLGFAVRAAGLHAHPAAARLLMVTNAFDRTVNNQVTAQFAESWQTNDPAHVTTYEFDHSLQLPHDLIGPHRPDQRIDIVYPTLINLITGLFEDS